MKCAVTSLGQVASQTTIGNHTITFDQPAQVPGGTDRGPSPLDVMLASVAACAHYFAAAFLQARNLPTNELTVTAEAEKATEPFPHLRNVHLNATVPAATPERYLPALQRVMTNCPAYGTLRQPAGATLTISISGQAGKPVLLGCSSE